MGQSAKKRRSGKKLKMRVKKKYKFDHFQGHKEIKKYWDKKKSAAVNLANMGLDAFPGALKRDPVAVNPHAKPIADILAEIQAEQQYVKKPSYRSLHPMDKEDEKYMAKCMTKHGDNYLAMFRDIRVNDMQHTEHKLRKMGSKYLALTPEQRTLPVPAAVQHLLPTTTTTAVPMSVS